MKQTVLCCSALALTCAIALAAPAAASSSNVHWTKVHRVAHHQAIPVTAEALTPARTVRERETDGLSRDREDCNMGCIDNTP